MLLPIVTPRDTVVERPPMSIVSSTAKSSKFQTSRATSFVSTQTSASLFLDGAIGRCDRELTIPVCRGRTNLQRSDLQFADRLVGAPDRSQCSLFIAPPRGFRVQPVDTTLLLLDRRIDQDAQVARIRLQGAAPGRRRNSAPRSRSAALPDPCC